MRFHAVHKLMSYLLAASAVCTLITSGTVPVATLALLLIVGVMSWFVEPGTRMGGLLDRAGLVFNVGALAFFGLSLYQVVRSFPEPDLTPILNLVIFLLAYKLFHRRSNRDYLQLYILSFMLVVAGASFGQSVLFVVGFASYVVLATWTLILFHLRREIEDNYLVKHSPEAGAEKVTAARVLNSRRVVGRQFFFATGAMAIGVFVGAAVIFAAIPRIGVGFLMGGMRRRVNLIGFSDEVTLGQHGVMSSENDTVVMRARIPRITDLANDEARDMAISGLYWRGKVFDQYESGRWVASAYAPKTMIEAQPQSDETVWLVRKPTESKLLKQPSPAARRTSALAQDEQEIWIVGLSHPVAFGLDQPVGYRTLAPPLGSFQRVVIEGRASDEVALKNMLMSARGEQPLREFKGAHYFVYSRDSQARARMIHAPAERIPELMQPYLAKPTSMSPRVQALAEQLTRGMTKPIDKVNAISAWLKRTHGYTMNLKRDTSTPDPVEDFIFNQKAGHCEYFASAAALLLRFSGVPTRYVNGFLGGEWNSITSQVAIRDNRAHSWIEVYMDTFGWVRFDATPATSAPSRMGRLRQLFDSVELLWSRWVIDYDVSRQVEIARSLGKTFGLERQRKPGGGFRWGHVGWAVSGLALCGFGYFVWRRFSGQPPLWGGVRRGRLNGLGDAPIARLWHSTVEGLGKRGWPRRPAETPREYAARLAGQSLPGTDALARLAHHYGVSRYGEREIPSATVNDLREAVALLETVPAPVPTAGPPAAPRPAAGDSA